MSRIISLLRQLMIVFLVVIAVFITQAFGYSNNLQAQAEPVTPEATYYQAKGNDTNKIENDNKLVERSRKNLKETADNVREKLNVDEPSDPGTKGFFNSVQEKVEDVLRPITGQEQR